MDRRAYMRLVIGGCGGGLVGGCGSPEEMLPASDQTLFLGGKRVPRAVVTEAPGWGRVARAPAGANRLLYPASFPVVLADSVLVLDIRTGRTIGHKNPDRRRAVASTQKLLSALLILERGGLERQVTIAHEDTLQPPSKMYLKVGERYTRRELLSVVLVKSANDAAAALARDHSGSTGGFAEAMNRRARVLGAGDSRFVNAHGLTEAGQYSTARNIAKIAMVAYRQPFVRDMARRQSVSVRGKNYKATNKLLKRMVQCTGLKTGYTVASGRCFVCTAKMGAREVMVVQLGSKESVIWKDTERLLWWAARV